MKATVCDTTTKSCLCCPPAYEAVPLVQVTMGEEEKAKQHPAMPGTYEASGLEGGDEAQKQIQVSCLKPHH